MLGKSQKKAEWQRTLDGERKRFSPPVQNPGGPLQRNWPWVAFPSTVEIPSIEATQLSAANYVP
jgi:hypothetical protein